MSAFVKLLSADFYFNQEVKMQIIKILSIGLVGLVGAAALAGCDQATQPETRAGNEKQITPAINALTKMAALQAGYQITREAALPDEEENDPFESMFSAQTLDAMRNAGLCQGFISLLEEISRIDKDTSESLVASSHLMQVGQCLVDKIPSLTNTQDPKAVLGAVEDCFCGGTGTLFAGFSLMSLNAYAPPVTARTYNPPTSTGSPYGPPAVVPGYSAPSIPGYKAPSL